jgi:hypothetical protein
MLLWVRVSASVTNAQYVGHTDERHMYGQAKQVIDVPLNPEFFRYPSLPIYLTAGAMSITMAINDTYEFEVPEGPGKPYEPAAPYHSARALFGAIGGLVFFLSAWLVRAMTGRFTWAWLAPSFVGLSPLTQRLLVRYHNVDTPTLFLALTTLVVVLWWWDSDSVWKKAVIPGVLCGLTTACKYNSGLIVLPCAMAIALTPTTNDKRRMLVILCASAALAFFVVVPYALLDYRHFVRDVWSEIEHYKTGHPGKDGPAGIPQLLYYLEALRDDAGEVLCGLSLVGIATSIRRWPRRAATVLVFPVVMLVHMSTNRVHFLRTVLPLFAIVPIFAAIGVSGLVEFGRRGVARIRSPRIRQIGSIAAYGIMGISLAWGVSATTKTAVWADRNVTPESRVQVTRWLTENFREGTVLYVARDLWMSTDPLERFDLRELSSGLVAPHSIRGPALVLLPEFGPPRRVPPDIRDRPHEKRAYVDRARERGMRATARRDELIQNMSARQLRRVGERPVALVEADDVLAQAVRDPVIGIYVVD